MCWIGNDDECYDVCYDVGVVGVISVIFNFVLEFMREMLFDGSNSEFCDRFLLFMNWFFVEFNFMGINIVCVMFGVV